MFKNLIAFKLDGELPGSAQMEDELATLAWHECGPTQDYSFGLVPPRGHKGGALVELVGGHRIMRWQTETKRIPGDIVSRKLEQACAEIEKETGWTPRGKARREIREQIVQELLPQAFPRRAAVPIWIEPRRGWMVVGAANYNRAVGIAGLLCEPFGLSLATLLEWNATHRLMLNWLLQPEDAEAFGLEVGHHVQLVGDEPKVRFDRYQLAPDDMREHIDAGRVPVSLEILGKHCEFVLTPDSIKRIVLDVDAAAQPDADEGFDADVALATGLLTEVLEGLEMAMKPKK